MSTILVTGGAGFIGSNFVRGWLSEENDAVVVLDKLSYAGNLANLAEVKSHPRLEFVRGDIGDAEQVRALLHRIKPRAIVNLAAESHVDRSIDGPAPFVLTNVLGTVMLLDVARQYWHALPEHERQRFRFLHISTDEVFGSLAAEGQFSIETPYSPNSPYAASKAASDHFVRAYHHTFGLPTLITNCSNNYGPYQFPEKLLPLMILNAIEGRSLPVYGDGRQVRDWLHVDDHCRGLRAVLAGGKVGETYLLGGSCERTNLEIVQAICREVDAMYPDLPHAPTNSLITHVADRPGHDRRYAIDASKTIRELDWHPRIAFEQGLRDTVRWYAQNSAWVETVSAGKYDRQRLGVGS